MISQNELGRRIRELRERRSMTQADLAEGLDIDPSGISRTESGERGVDALELARIAELLRVSPLEFLADADTTLGFHGFFYHPDNWRTQIGA